MIIFWLLLRTLKDDREMRNVMGLLNSSFFALVKCPTGGGFSRQINLHVWAFFRHAPPSHSTAVTRV